MPGRALARVFFSGLGLNPPSTYEGGDLILGNKKGQKYSGVGTVLCPFLFLRLLGLAGPQKTQYDYLIFKELVARAGFGPATFGV